MMALFAGGWYFFLLLLFSKVSFDLVRPVGSQIPHFIDEFSRR